MYGAMTFFNSSDELNYFVNACHAFIDSNHGKSLAIMRHAQSTNHGDMENLHYSMKYSLIPSPSEPRTHARALIQSRVPRADSAERALIRFERVFVAMR